MQPQNRDREKSFADTINDTFNFVDWATQIWSYPLMAILRKPGTFGDRFLNLRAVLGLIWLGVFIVLMGGNEEQPFAIGAWAVCIFFLLLHRLRGVDLRRKGYEVPSLYDGESWFKGDELKAKGTYEPALLFIAGFLCLSFSMGIGFYLLIGGFCHAFGIDRYKREKEARLRAIRDARFQQELLIEELHERRRR